MASVSVGDYCRQVEAYLCRKNEGHLVRLVGPAFDLVCQWAEKGIPLQVAERGIDRCVERAQAKGPRRRPMRIEFCDADVLDAFDDWRRAIAATEATGEASTQAEPARAGAGGGTLPAHLARVIARLTAARAGVAPEVSETLGDIVREVDRMAGDAARSRGQAREAVIERLRDLDDRVVEVLRAAADAPTLQALAERADDDLQAFRGRLPRDAYERAHRASVDRLLRERARVPSLAYE